MIYNLLLTDKILHLFNTCSASGKAGSSMYDAWTLHQLQSELRIRGQPISGNKQALRERLLKLTGISNGPASSATPVTFVTVKKSGTASASTHKRTKSRISVSHSSDIELLNYRGIFAAFYHKIMFVFMKIHASNS